MSTIAQAREWIAMRFDGTIGLGSIINLIVMLAGGVAFLLSYEHRMTLMEAAQTQQVQRDMQQDNAATSMFASINSELRGVRERLDRMTGTGPH
jgi:hypothetical protein